MRSFVAVALPDACAPAIESLRRALAGAAAGLRWVRADGAHVTLAFLGDLARKRVPDVVRRIEEAARASTPFPVELGGLGVFPHPRRATVLWLGIRDPSGGLARLQREVAAGLTLEGFVLDDRPFEPHVTLGRWRDPPEPARVEAVLGARAPMPEDAWMVRDVRLMESRLAAGGSVYTIVNALPLGASEGAERR